jgi:PAS domain S-box-containing protein
VTILFTGRGWEDVVIQALNDGADYYLQKGGDPKPQFAELTHKMKLAVQRRNINEELRESERRYREVVETQSEFISRFTPDGISVFVNDAYCRYFGKNRDEIIGHRFISDIPEEDRKHVLSHFASLSGNPPVGEIEHRIRMPDGSIRWHRWRDQAIFDETGTLIEYQLLGKEITDRKLAEEELERSENLYRTIFEKTGAATLIYDESRTILRANAEFARISGYDRENVEGKRAWTDFIVKEDLARMETYDKARTSAHAGVPSLYEFRLMDRDGNIRYCINNVAMIAGSDRSVASAIIMHQVRK